MTKNHEYILQWGFIQLMNLPVVEVQLAETKMYYRYFKKNIKKLESLNTKFGEYIKTYGTLIVENTLENEMISKMIEFYFKVHKIWEVGFLKNANFYYQIKSGI